MSEHPYITVKKHTFLSALAMGLSSVLIVLILCCTAVIIFGINFIDNQSDKIITVAGSAVEGLPELRKVLPPVIAEALNDRREPNYRDKIKISPKICKINSGGRIVSEIEAVNNGDEVISYLSMRLVILNADNNIVSASNEWVATPIAIENDWPGPLMPGSKRHLTSFTHRMCEEFSLDDIRTEVEITDIRIWNSEDQIPAADEHNSKKTAMVVETF